MTYDEHYDWAKSQLGKLETSKKKVIIELAIRLENSGMPVESICANISSNLSQDGYATDRYVREVLDNTKYKRKYQNKFTEDIGSSSELTQPKEERQSQEILVSNTGKQISSKAKPKNEEKLVPLSDLIGMERAVYDRDKTIKDLREKNKELEKQSALTQEANKETDLKEQEGTEEFVKIADKLYSKLKHTLAKAIRNKLPFIMVEYQGGEATDIDTI